MRALTKKNLLILGSILLTFAVVQALIWAGILNSFYEITIAMICINVILAVSLNLVTGFTGQFSLGHAGFMSIGAYVCALISMRMGSTQGFLLGIITGALAAAFVGILIGIPTLRLKGDYLAIATLGMAEIVRVVFLNLEITNGAAGLNGIPRYANWLWLFFFTVTAIVLINNFLKSSPGRACIAIREDEIAAEAMGINLAKHKMLSFCISSFFAGIGGALLAMYQTTVQASAFKAAMTYEILLIVVIGGIGSVTGSIISSFLFIACSEWWLRFLDAPLVISGFQVPFLRSGFRKVVFSIIIMAVVLFYRQGIMGDREFSLRRIGNFLRRKAYGKEGEAK